MSALEQLRAAENELAHDLPRSHQPRFQTLKAEIQRQLDQISALQSEAKELQREAKEFQREATQQKDALHNEIKELYKAKEELKEENHQLRVQVNELKTERDLTKDFLSRSVANASRKALAELADRQTRQHFESMLPAQAKRIKWSAKDRKRLQGDWESLPRESGLQDQMKEMMPALNSPSSTLHWDFEISGTPTLLSKRPDGHGRLNQHDKNRRYIAQQAVLVVLKWGDKALQSAETHGQVLESSAKLLSVDRTRRFVYVLLTNLVHCRLYKVHKSILEGVDSKKADKSVLLSEDFNWQEDDSPRSRLLGPEVLVRLGHASKEELGLAPRVDELSKHDIQSCLGQGASAVIYELPDHEVLKVAHLDQFSLLEHEVKMYRRLEDAVGQHPQWDRHAPQVQKMGDGVLKMRPMGARLASSNVKSHLAAQLFEYLKFVHHTAKLLHGDISDSNLIIAPGDWRSNESKESSREQVLVLIDWGLARNIGPDGRQEANDDVGQQFHGTPMTMSQSCLAHGIRFQNRELAQTMTDVTFEADYRYSIADELESAVKGFILILLPHLKVRLKRLMLSIGTARPTRPQCDLQVFAFWQEVLAESGLLELCKERDYDALAGRFREPVSLRLFTSSSDREQRSAAVATPDAIPEEDSSSPVENLSSEGMAAAAAPERRVTRSLTQAQRRPPAKADEMEAGKSKLGRKKN